MPHQGVVDRLVAVRVIAAHHLAHHLGAFAGRGVGVQPHLAHGVEHAALHGLQPVAHVGQRPVGDDAERIGQVAPGQRLAQRLVDDAVARPLGGRLGRRRARAWSSPRSSASGGVGATGQARSRALAAPCAGGRRRHGPQDPRPLRLLPLGSEGMRLADFLGRPLNARGDEASCRRQAVGLPMLDRMYKEYRKGEAPPAMEALAERSARPTPSSSSTGEYNWGVQPGPEEPDRPFPRGVVLAARGHRQLLVRPASPARARP